VHYFDERIQRLTEDFKIECLQTITEEEITRQEIADILTVNHTTISRWFSSGDLHFPACLVPALNTPHLKPLAESMLRFQASRLGYSLSKRICASSLDGKIDDEVFDVVQHLGRAVQAVKDGKISLRNCRKELQGVIEAAQQAMQELDGMEKH
jgi:predicted site-specific integrase-resolvase